MSNNDEARARHKIGTQISKKLIPLRSRPEVAKQLGISAEAVRQIETAALFKIQKRLGILLEIETRGNIDIDWTKA